MPIVPGERSTTDFNTPVRYFQAVWDMRHFLMNSVRLELANRFRHTRLGVLYIVLMPLVFALMFAWMLSTLQGQQFGTFVFYVYVNLILWEKILNSVSMASMVIASSEGYIRIQRFPLLVFPLRLSITLVVSLFISSVGVLLLALVIQPSLITFTTPIAYINALFIAACLLPFAIVSGFVGLIFRDWRQISGILMQALWFVSPVFLHTSIFERPDLALWNTINPVAQAMELWRLPLIEGKLPSLDAYLILGAWGVAGYIVSTLMIARFERRALYYM
jgi:lipopolysaccharide transport system permease protein